MHECCASLFCSAYSAHPHARSICQQTLERNLHANRWEIAIAVTDGAAADSDIFTRVLKLESAVGGMLTKKDTHSNADLNIN